MSASQIEEIVSRLGAVTGSWGAETTPAQMRREFEAYYAGYAERPGTRITAVSAPAGEWVDAPEASDRHAILLLHGGGFMVGSARAHRAYASYLSAAAKARVFSLDYRLIPEHPFPAALEDSVDAYEWLLSQGIPADRIAICGDSAGGGLALSLVIQLRDSGRPLPASVILVSPWADLAAEGQSYARNAAVDPVATPEGARLMGQLYVGETGDVRAPLANALHADLQGLPPMLIQVGEREIFLDDSCTIDRKLRAAGGDSKLQLWPGMIHQFPLHVGRLDESHEAVTAIGEFAIEKFGKR